MKNLKIFLFTILVLGLGACKKYLTVEPAAEVTTEKMFETKEGYVDALTGVYINMRKNYSPASFLINGGIEDMANLYTVVNTTTASYMLTQHNYLASLVDDQLNATFLNNYNAIANLNNMLEALSGQTVLEDRVAKVVEGEALGLRAFLHFDLIRLWGPMPSSIGSKTYLPYVTSTSKENYQYDTYQGYMAKLSADLDKAESLLLTADPILKYSNTALNVSTASLTGYKELYWYYRQNRMNYYAVLGLQARVKLWMGDKDSALKYAKMVVDATNTDATKKFTLGTRTNTTVKNYVFFTEHLFGLNLAGGFDDAATASGRFATRYQPQSRILNDLYENVSDLRSSTALWYYTTITGVSGTAMTSKKYAEMTVSTGSTNPYSVPLIRLSEMYLIIAECASLTEANSYYQTFRTSREASYTPMTESNRPSVMLKEYLKEFYAEGQAFFTYKRFGTQNMLWSNHTTGETQYVPSLPSRESGTFR